MTNIKATKRALGSSVLALFLCFAMLLGTTFAWFTDSVTSANNIITAGNLDVELYHTNAKDTDEKVGETTELFDDIALWEPGAIVYENFKVVNEGTLAFKYQWLLNVANAKETEPGNGKTLADVLKVAVVAGGFNGTREDAQNLAYNYSLATFALEGKLEPTKYDTYGIVIYWEPSANDNDYNVKGGLTIELGVTLMATQVTSESDSFGPDYDVDTELPAVPDNGSTTATIKNDGSASMETDVAPSATTNKTTINAPAGTFNPTDKVEVAVETINSLFNVNASGNIVASLDINMTVNGAATSADLADDKVFTVTTYISKGLSNVSVAYTGTDGKDQPTFVSYDAVTGELVFTTNHFSNYAVSGEALAYDVENDTALTTIEQVVEASKVENNTVVIPEENKTAIEEAIKTLPEEEQEAATAITAAAKIGDTTYATLTEALNAAKDNDTIVILSNVAVSEMFVNKKVITLDLNGKTIACTDTTSKNFSFIDNRGTLTIKGEGKITVIATINSGWNRYSAVIANNPGGKLVVENGIIEHLGGTDMAYGIDNLTNGKGTYAETVINGGTIKSVYRAIRQFLNGIEAQNILTINGGTIEGANKSVWMQDPSKNANTGKLTVSDKAVLNGDVYLFVTAGSTEWPVDVSIADAAVNGDVITGNVPDGYRVSLVGGVWQIFDDVTVVRTADELVAALEGGEATYIQFKNDIKIDPANMSNAYGTTGINIKNGQTIDGNGYTLDVKGAGGTWDSGINTTGGVIKNIKVTGSFRGIFINHNSTHSEPVVLENVIIDGTTYTISCDQGMNQTLIATNCTFNGWTSYAATLGEATFVNCKFGKGNGYAYCRPYAPTTFVGCEFGTGYAIDTTRTEITFENCTKVVADSDELAAALKLKDIYANLYLLDGEYYVDLYNIDARDSLTITGQGADTKIKFANLQVRASQFKNLTIDNCTIERMPDKAWGHLVFGSSATAGGEYTISNCIFNGVSSQGIFINQTVEATFNIENCTFNGDFGDEGAITIQNNDGVDITVNVTGCDFNNIPATSHEMFLHYAYDGLTLNADGVNVCWKVNQ